MGTRMAVVLHAAVVLTALLPSAAVAHHMGQGLGSAPGIVDNYALGAARFREHLAYSVQASKPLRWSEAGGAREAPATAKHSKGVGCR